MSDEKKRLFQNLMHMHRLEHRFGRAGETQQLIDQRIDPVDLVADQVRKCFAKIGILISLRQQLREGFDGDERVFDLMRHPR